MPQAKEYREKMIEAISDVDEKIMEKFLAGSEISAVGNKGGPQERYGGDEVLLRFSAGPHLRIKGSSSFWMLLLTISLLRMMFLRLLARILMTMSEY